MRRLAFLGLALAVALTPAMAESAPGHPGGRPPGGMTMHPGPMQRPPSGMWTRGGWGSQWNGQGHWRGNGGAWQARGGNWQRWHGGQRFQRGVFLPSFWVSPRFFVTDWYGYGLGRPGYDQNWVRYYDDAYLIDRRGMVYDSVYDIDWDHDGYGPAPEYGGGYDEDYGDLAYDDDSVTWGGRPQLPHAVPPRGQVYYVPPGTTVIIQQPTMVKTTTYVEEEVIRPASRKKAWKAKPRAKRAWKAKPRPQCFC